MSILEEVKSLFEKELKKYKKLIKAISDKYEEISQEHELLLADVEALDTRLIYVEKKLKITDDNEIYNNSTNNIKDISEFRYQIITRSKAKQLKNKQKLNKSEDNEEQNSSDNVVSEGKRSNENSRKKNQRKKSKSKEKGKGKNNNKRNYSNKNNHENKNKEEFNKFHFDDNNKLEKTYNGINPLLIQDNNSFYNSNNNNIENNNSIEAMSFKNKNMNINETNSLLSISENFSEFSFNPQKLQKKNNNFFNRPLPLPKNFHPIKDLKSIISSEIIKSIEEIELILKSVHNYNKFDDTPTIQAIFQSSSNGDSAQTFHKFCDGEPNVIVVIETNKGNRFGGFTTIGFNSDNEVKKDYYAFLFSFDLMKIYKSKSGKKNIFCKENFGPCFGDKDNKDLMISDKFSSNESFVGKCNGCFLNINQDYEINNGNSNFIVNKLEIFKLLI